MCNLELISGMMGLELKQMTQERFHLETNWVAISVEVKNQLEM